MRRILLILAAACLLTLLLGILVPHAGASRKTFDDLPCLPSGAINICPQATVGQAYSVQLLARKGTGCEPFVTWRIINSSPPPGLSFSSSGLISGTPTQAGTFLFWVELQDVLTPQDTWCVPKAYQRQMQITVNPAPAPALKLYWHLLAGATVLHSERATTYPDGSTGLGNMLRWMLVNKAPVRVAGKVGLERVLASS